MIQMFNNSMRVSLDAEIILLSTRGVEISDTLKHIYLILFSERLTKE